MIDIIGKTFGNLTAIENAGTSLRGRLYVFKCNCGRKITRLGTIVATGRQSACGCQIGAKNIGRRNADLAMRHVGERHGRLLIIGITRHSSGGYRMKCRCDCGNEKVNVYSDLHRQRVVSCGCWQREKASITGASVGKDNSTKNRHWYFHDAAGSKIHCRSGYEAIYATWLVKSEVQFSYEPITLRTNSGLRYIPDFYLTATSEYVEIKGRWQRGQKDKLSDLQNGEIVRVLEWRHLVKMCKLSFSAYATLARRAKSHGKTRQDFVASGDVFAD